LIHTTLGYTNSDSHEHAGSVMITIRTEQDAWDYLFRCWSDPSYGNDGPVAFDHCQLNIRLDPGSGKADWKTNRTLGLIQRHFNLMYQLARRGEPSGSLTAYDRERLSLAVDIGSGSTVLGIDVSKPLEALQKALPAHWSPRAKNLVTVGVLLATISLPFVMEFRSYRTAIDTARIAADASIEAASLTGRADVEIARIHADAHIAAARVKAGAAEPVASSRADELPLSRTAPMDAAAVLLAELAHSDPSRLVRFAASDYVPWRPALLELAPYAGTIRWQEGTPMPAPVAKAAARSARTEATKQRRIAKKNGQRGIIATPWITEVVRSHSAPGAMRLGLSDA
jgi:hypothetical protein